MKLSRRTLLRGAGGVAVALPTLEAMLNSQGTAFAAGEALPKRFMTWFFGNGVRLDRWVPTATGTGWALSPELAPLVDAVRGIDVKSYVSVVSGCNVKTPNLRGHHNGAAALLSGAPFIPLPAGSANYSSKFGMKSIDQVVADSIGTTTQFKSLQLAVSKRFTTGEGPTLRYLSHRGPDEPLPQDTNPVTVFNRIFGSFSTTPTTDPRNRLRTSVLDVVKDDAARVRVKLGTQDKQRLDAHLTAISEVRTQILALPPVVTSTCLKPAAPTTTNVDVGGAEPYMAVNKAMSDLLAIAFACDLTRVASYQFSGSVGGQSYKDLTAVRDNEHSITHDSARQNDVHAATLYEMQAFAYTLQALKRVSEGAGNLLDQSCILCTSDVAEGLAHSINNYPILVAGRAGGALRPSQHYRSTTGRNTSDVLLSCLKATLGPSVTSVGKDSGLSTTPVTELLT